MPGIKPTLAACEGGTSLCLITPASLCSHLNSQMDDFQHPEISSSLSPSHRWPLPNSYQCVGVVGWEFQDTTPHMSDPPATGSEQATVSCAPAFEAPWLLVTVNIMVTKRFGGKVPIGKDIRGIRDHRPWPPKTSVSLSACRGVSTPKASEAST